MGKAKEGRYQKRKCKVCFPKIPAHFKTSALHSFESQGNRTEKLALVSTEIQGTPYGQEQPLNRRAKLEAWHALTSRLHGLNHPDRVPPL